MSADAEIAAVRRFSRFYTRQIGVLDDSLLGSGLTLPQARIVYEIANGPDEGTSPGAIASHLGLDAGYVSRLAGALQARGLIEKSASAADGRGVVLKLGRPGRRIYAEMDKRSSKQVAQLLEGLGAGARARLVAAMRVIEAELGEAPTVPSVVIRGPRPGDIGWVVHRHGAIYAAEYGWDWTFEALVAKVAAAFIEAFDAKRDCCRIAEAGGRIVGSSFVVRGAEPHIAKLRLVYVEADVRGGGVGLALVEDCMAFARSAGYTRMTLWTNDVLVAARRLYQRLGFEMVASESYRGFGKDLVGETWERDL